MSLSLSELLNPAPYARASTAEDSTAEAPDVQPQADVGNASDVQKKTSDKSVNGQTDSIAQMHASSLEMPEMGLDITQSLTSMPEDQLDHGIAQQGVDGAVQISADTMGLVNDTTTVSRAYNVIPPTLIKTDAETSVRNILSESPAPTTKPRPPSKSTTKNEGLHSDKRYLCYLCNKLFTRRRSVRDHISKIHNTKTWDPTRSLEIIVNPATGDPVEPLEAQIAQFQADHPHKDDSEDQTEESPPVLTANNNVKIESSVGGSRASSVEHFMAPAPVIGKKRAAPTGSSPHPAKIMKKGTAKPVKHATPKRMPKQTESDSTHGVSPTRSPGATPVSARVKAPTKLAKQSSMSAASSPAPSEDPQSETAYDEDVSADTPNTNDDGEIFCICRKGDNHTWMIACDGGCEEWFHGGCVNIRERDGDLIDKYICPNCRRDGYQTTWKRMCRRQECRKPARVLDDPPSKYCSVECGRRFMVEMILRSDPNAVASEDGLSILDVPKPKKYRHKIQKLGSQMGRKLPLLVQVQANGDTESQDTPVHDTNEDDARSEYETDSSADEEDLPNRGGGLRLRELKAILDQCTTIEQFRQLGKKPVGVPIKQENESEIKVIFDTFEKTRLEQLAEKMNKCHLTSQMWTDRETFLEIIKARSMSITEEVRKQNPKSKDLCGFDARLIWVDEQFIQWRDSAEGVAALSSKTIGPPDDLGSENSDVPEVLPKKGGVCIKNRCLRHSKWQKMQLAKIRFEQDLNAKLLEKLGGEEKAIRDRASLRAWEQSAA